MQEDVYFIFLYILNRVKMFYLRMRNEGLNLSEFSPRKEVSSIYLSNLFLPFFIFLISLCGNNKSVRFYELSFILFLLDVV